MRRSAGLLRLPLRPGLPGTALLHPQRPAEALGRRALLAQLQKGVLRVLHCGAGSMQRVRGCAAEDELLAGHEQHRTEQAHPAAI